MTSPCLCLAHSPYKPCSNVYSMGIITEGAINDLHFVANLANHVQVRTAAEGEDAASVALKPQDAQVYFPTILWALRDVGTLEMVDEVRFSLSPRSIIMVRPPTNPTAAVTGW